MCRLQTDVAEPELADALASTAFRADQGQTDDAKWARPVQTDDAKWARPIQARRLMARAQPQLGVSNVSTDLDCDGCSTTDTRAQVLVRSADIRLQPRSVLAPH